MKTIALIAAVAKNQVIGKNGTLPWHCPEDLRHFRRLTSGHTIIMGRKTFTSIGKPLPKRENIVVSSQMPPQSGLLIAHSLEEALDRAQSDPLFVIGGAMLFQQALPLADYLYLTQIEQDFAGDTHFPELDMNDWLVENNHQVWDGVSGFRLRFLTLSRRRYVGIQNDGMAHDRHAPFTH